MRAFSKLAWLEFKIFAREPLGLLGALILPTVIVVGIGRTLGGGAKVSTDVRQFIAVDLPVLAAIMAALNAVLSLVTIVSIYREGGILKRLRATPLRPTQILSAHVAVKGAMTIATLIIMTMAGRSVLPMHLDWRTASFITASLISLISLVSIGFLIASVIPTARFAQPIGAFVLYPLLAVSGLFAPLNLFPKWVQVLAHLLPFPYAVNLLRGMWLGEAWAAHATDVAALAIFTIVLTAISSRVFRWQ